VEGVWYPSEGFWGFRGVIGVKEISISLARPLGERAESGDKCVLLMEPIVVPSEKVNDDSGDGGYS